MYFCKLHENNTMSPRKIFAVVQQELFITARSFEIFVDIIFFNLINIFIFGFISLWLAGDNRTNAYFILSGMIFWQIVYSTQYSLSVGSLWNIWSRNLSNMFIAPLAMKEYIAAHMLSGLIKTTVIFVASGVLSIFVFKFNVFALGLTNILIWFIHLNLFALSLGLFVLGIIFMYGTRIQAIAWSVAFLFQPLSAAFYPLKVLPPFIQKISILLPTTYVFEAMRAEISGASTTAHGMLIALGLNCIYLILSFSCFTIFLRKSKMSGQFARNDG